MLMFQLLYGAYTSPCVEVHTTSLTFRGDGEKKIMLLDL